MSIAVFGGGVAGMTAAHELAERGFSVSLYEKNPVMGGKSRSFGQPETGTGGRLDLPGEHGFRFFPGFYSHVPDVMKRINIGNGETVFDNLIDVEFSNLYFNNAPPVAFPSNTTQINTPAEIGLILTSLFNIQGVGLAPDDAFFFAERMLCAWGSCTERREADYENMDWATFIKVDERGPAYRRVFADGLARPLVAMNPSETNARTAVTIMLQIFQNMIFPGQSADRILNDPTTVAWIDPWHAYLETLCDSIELETEVSAIQFANGEITGVDVTHDGTVSTIVADYYIFAMPHEALVPLLTPEIKAQAPSLNGLSALENNWMTGLLYYLSGPAEIADGHAIYADSPWAFTSIWQLQNWNTVQAADIGDGSITAIASTIISNWDKPGPLTGKKATDCTEQEIVDEVRHQLNAHLNNAGLSVNQADISTHFLDPAIEFDLMAGVVSDNKEPLLINTVDSWKNRPTVLTGIPNMLLAGDYVRTKTNLATMEGACEAARAATTHILIAEGWTGGAFPEPYPLWEPNYFDGAKEIDKGLFQLGMDQLCLTDVFQLQRLAEERGLPDLAPVRRNAVYTGATEK